MPTTRRMLKLSPEEGAQLQAHAAELGVSVSALGREWIEDFVVNGSDIPKNVTDQRVQILVDRDTLAQAMIKARDEYGVDLSQILRHNIASLRQ